jgi:hypothetical protein
MDGSLSRKLFVYEMREERNGSTCFMHDKRDGGYDGTIKTYILGYLQQIAHKAMQKTVVCIVDIIVYLVKFAIYTTVYFTSLNFAKLT